MWKHWSQADVVYGKVQPSTSQKKKENPQNTWTRFRWCVQCFSFNPIHWMNTTPLPVLHLSTCVRSPPPTSLTHISHILSYFTYFLSNDPFSDPPPPQIFALFHLIPQYCGLVLPPALIIWRVAPHAPNRLKCCGLQSGCKVPVISST